MIKSISKENKERELVFNDSFILVEKYDTLECDISWKNYNFKLIFRFDDNGENFKSTLNPSSNDSFDVSLHRWYSTTFVESSSPWYITYNKRNFVVQFRTMATEKLSQRVFQLSIWTDKDGI